MRAAELRLSSAEAALTQAESLRILIVGYGNFGQFIGATFVQQGHIVIGTSRGDYAEQAREIGAQYTTDANSALDYDPHVVIFSTSILSTESVLKGFPIERLKGRLVVDVLSVKEYPKTLLLEMLPPTVDVLCTHPMFGPQSGKDSWQDLPFVYDMVRISSGRGTAVCEAFIGIWRTAGCRMVEMTCEEHDSYAAATQFITHTTGRMLAELAPTATPIDTRGYESLLRLVHNTVGDSHDLYCGLFYYNAFSKDQLSKLEAGLKQVRLGLEDFEAQRMEAEGGPAAHWTRSPQRIASNPHISACGDVVQGC